ncbi:hypothetical protein SEA_MOLIVIA_87 [Arthrobacter phage Molivia]|uniref:Uncharacterized protein n=1 Tax=Arthrobacter phage Molivia TaxID=2015839 RepID=A0A286S1U7_9CAUD|nr:hypothetical protein FDI28_gp29 [Arthrobacter phage Molivia]ASX99308.1 hypothetical protein SEA_MOLIVIA_87 [Arthrobacter phage Molivia]
MHNVNDSITIETLLSMVEAKFHLPYVASATLVAWNVETETAEVHMSFTLNGKHDPEQDMTLYAQAAFCGGEMGAATAVHPFTARQGERYYVPVTAS